MGRAKMINLPVVLCFRHFTDFYFHPADWVCCHFTLAGDGFWLNLKQIANQTDDQAVAEDEAAYEDRTQSVMEIPVELVPLVRELLAKHAG